MEILLALGSVSSERGLRDPYVAPSDTLSSNESQPRGSYPGRHDLDIHL